MPYQSDPSEFSITKSFEVNVQYSLGMPYATSALGRRTYCRPSSQTVPLKCRLPIAEAADFSAFLGLT